MHPPCLPSRRRSASLASVAVVCVALAAAGLASAAKPPKPKPPPKGGAGQVSIASMPHVVLFPGGSAVSGQLTGVPNVVGIALTLEQSTYPFKSFNRLANGSTSAGGAYTFAVSPAGNTRYRVTAKTSPGTTSAEVDVLVKKRVTIAARGRRVTGVVSPAHNGDPVELQRRNHGRYGTVETGRIAGAGTAGGRYRFSVHRAGVYRARVPADADHLTGTSASRTVR
jgi:hypothetical protein